MNLRTQRFPDVCSGHIDDEVCAVLACKGRFSRRAYRRQHPRAQTLADLHGGHPDSACGAAHEHRLTRSKAASIDQGQIRRLVNQTQRRSMRKAQPIWKLKGLCRGDQNLLRKRTMLDVTEYPVT